MSGQGAWIDRELRALEAAGLRRGLRVREAGPGGAPAGVEMDFSSNDYLGLSTHPAVVEGARRALERWGAGAGGSRLMCGTLEIHARAETVLADWIGFPAGLVYGSGFLANLGVIGAVSDRHTVIFEDRLNHASLIDGARLAGARLVRYRHADAGHLEELLLRHPAVRRWVVSDTVFSMDGDLAPVKSLARLCEQHAAGFMADEAHAIGVFGPLGRGVCALEGVRPDILVGTFSKALGSYGGFALMGNSLRDYMINRSRAFIYSTALPPACLGAALAAAGRIREAGGALGRDLLQRAAGFRAALQRRGFQTGNSRSPIVPVMLGDNRRALAAARELNARGIGAVAIRPPTVPRGAARLRLSVTLRHESEALERVAAEIESLPAPEKGTGA